MNTMCDMCCCGLWQDMACDTFLKIVQKCKRKFVTQQVCSRIFPKVYMLVLDISFSFFIIVLKVNPCWFNLPIMNYKCYSFYFHVVSLVLNSCISISSVDLRQVRIFTFAHFLQVGENEPFVSELLSNLATTIADLEPHQIHTFYESVC